MNCWTAEAISTYAVASMEARWKIRNANAMVVAPSLAARCAYGIDLRRLVEIDDGDSGQRVEIYLG